MTDPNNPNPNPDPNPDPNNPNPNPNPDPNPNPNPAPPAPAPAPAPAAPAPFPQIAGMTEEHWLDLEKRTGMKRDKLLLDMTFQTTMINNNPAIQQAIKVVEKDAFNSAKGELPQDFGVYEADIRKRAEALPAEARRDPNQIKALYFQVKGEKVTEAQLKRGADDQPIVPAVRRAPTNIITPGGPDPDPEPEPQGFQSSDPLEQRVAQAYGFKTRKEMKDNSSREVDTSFEKDWKPDFGKR